MFNMHEVCDIVMGDMSEYVKYNILNLQKKESKKNNKGELMLEAKRDEDEDELNNNN